MDAEDFSKYLFFLLIVIAITFGFWKVIEIALYQISFTITKGIKDALIQEKDHATLKEDQNMKKAE